MRLLWQLPGPKRFLERLADDLHENRSLVLLLPLHGPQEHGLRLEIIETCRQCGRSLEVFRVRTDVKPLRQLFDHFEIPPGHRLTVPTLLESDGFRGRTVWLDDLDSQQWQEWKPFIQEYQHVARSYGRGSRSLFIIPLVGPLAAEPPKLDVGLGVHVWEDVLDTLDIWLLAAHLLRRRDFAPILKLLLTATVAQVALFDPGLAEHLVDEPLDRILSPSAILDEYARRRGWTPETPATWQIGSACKVDSVQRAHSALKAIAGGVDRRLWRAQVAAVFPFLEEFRQKVVSDLQPHLQIPFRTRFGTVHDLKDLELGHLLYQVRKMGVPLDHNRLRALERAVDARNSLAHHDTLSARELIQLLV